MWIIHGELLLSLGHKRVEDEEGSGRLKQVTPVMLPELLRELILCQNCCCSQEAIEPVYGVNARRELAQVTLDLRQWVLSRLGGIYQHGVDRLPALRTVARSEMTTQMLLLSDAVELLLNQLAWSLVCCLSSCLILTWRTDLSSRLPLPLLLGSLSEKGDVVLFPVSRDHVALEGILNLPEAAGNLVSLVQSQLLIENCLLNVTRLPLVLLRQLLAPLLSIG